MSYYGKLGNKLVKNDWFWQSYIEKGENEQAGAGE